MKYMITYLPLEYEGETTVEIGINDNTFWEDKEEFKILEFPHICVKAKDYNEALEKAKIKLSKIAKKKKISKYIINNISNFNNCTEVHVIGAICNEQNTKIDWKYGE